MPKSGHCSIADCQKPVTTNGLCNMHYLRLRRHGTTDETLFSHGSAEHRFWKKVEKSDNCWMWTGATDRKGYGVFGAGNNKSNFAHRFSFEIHNGPIPEGMNVCHHCDTPSCVNPAHLFIGSQQDNMDDMDAKGRRVLNIVSGSANGASKLSEDQIAAIRCDTRPQREIASQYSVSQQQVSRIKSGKSWGFVNA